MSLGRLSAVWDITTREELAGVSHVFTRISPTTVNTYVLWHMNRFMRLGGMSGRSADMFFREGLLDSFGSYIQNPHLSIHLLDGSISAVIGATKRSFKASSTLRT